MKLAFLIPAIALGACSVGHAQWEPQYAKQQLEVDTTPRHIITLLQARGESDVIVTGLRTELCQDDHDLIGYGVIVKRAKKDGTPQAQGATVCLNWEDELTITLD